MTGRESLRAARELDVVTLHDGRVGTVVSVHSDGSLLVEVCDDEGRTLDLVGVCVCGGQAGKHAPHCHAPDLRACRLCGSRQNLTKHHLLKKRSARFVRIRHGLTNRKVWLCRACHDRFHSGSPESRQAAWDELLPLLTGPERRVRDLRPMLELWEQKLEPGDA